MANEPAKPRTVRTRTSATPKNLAGPVRRPYTKPAEPLAPRPRRASASAPAPAPPKLSATPLKIKSAAKPAPRTLPGPRRPRATGVKPARSLAAPPDAAVPVPPPTVDPEEVKQPPQTVDQVEEPPARPPKPFPAVRIIIYTAVPTYALVASPISIVAMFYLVPMLEAHGKFAWHRQFLLDGPVINNWTWYLMLVGIFALVLLVVGVLACLIRILQYKHANANLLDKQNQGASVRGWNWGAFFLTWIWGLANGVTVSLLTLIPGLGWPLFAIVLAAFGDRWAYRSRLWDSPERFHKVQRRWGITGAIVVLLIAALSAWTFIATR